MNDTPPNPYATDHLPPFAGRAMAFAHLQQHLSNPQNTPAVTFLGRRHIGKTTLLYQCGLIPNTLGVYIALRPDLDDESAWLGDLARILVETVQLYGFAPDSVTLPEESDNWGDWLVTYGLPALHRVIRPQRRLLLMLDDAHHLIEAVEQETVSRDLLVFLDNLRHPQFAITLTADLGHEDRLETLAPLVDVRNVHRLGNLTPEASVQVIRQSAYDISEAGAEAIYKQTGGEPVLLQRLGYHLYEHMQAGGTVTPQEIKAAQPQVYADCSAEFRLDWELLNRDERLVLTAISTLIYDNPTRPVDTDRIEAWLIETDYPMDSTAINAAIRGLEYHELVRGSAAKIILTSNLLQKWLLENALLNPADSGSGGEASLPWRWVALALVALVVGLLVIFFLLNGGEGGGLPLPTLTLEPGG